MLSAGCHILPGELQLQKEGIFDLNNARRDTSVPEVTLLIVIKHLTGSKRLGV